MDLYQSIMDKAEGMDEASKCLIATVAERYVAQVEALRQMAPEDVQNYSKAVTAANNTVLTLAKLMPDTVEKDESEGRMADILSAIRK